MSSASSATKDTPHPLLLWKMVVIFGKGAGSPEDVWSSPRTSGLATVTAAVKSLTLLHTASYNSSSKCFTCREYTNSKCTEYITT